MAFLELRQIYMVGSMTWITSPIGNREIVEAVQAHPASIMPTSATTSQIPVTRRWVRRSIDNDDLIASIDRVANSLAECLSLKESVLDRSFVSNEFPAL